MLRSLRIVAQAAVVSMLPVMVAEAPAQKAVSPSLLRQTGKVLKRGARDRHQRIDGDGVDAELCKADRHVQTVFPRLAHADDAAGTGAHALRLDLFQSLHFHIVGVGGADIWEVPL